MRLPVATKMALIKAGAKGSTPGSPTPLGGVSGSAGTMCTLVTSGASVEPDHREVVEIALLHLAVLEGDLAIFGEALRPMIAAPSICDRIRSGLTNMPQSRSDHVVRREAGGARRGDRALENERRSLVSGPRAP